MTSEYILGDWWEHRPAHSTVDLVIADPVYDTNTVWASTVCNTLRPGGAIYAFGDSTSIAHLKVELDSIKWMKFQNWLVWGPNDWGGRSSQRWGQKHDDILFYTRTGADHYFNGEAVAVPKKMTQDVFNPSGRTTKIPHSVWDDLGGFSTISKERIKVNGKAVRWQKPESVIRRIVLASSKPGDYVFDPFAGVATVSVVCAQLERRCLAIEIDPTVYAAGMKRLGR